MVAESGINIAVEGVTDERVIRKILEHLSLACGLVRGRKGKNHLLREIGKYNQAAQFSRWLVVIDLDHEACAVTYRNTILPEPSDNMLLRIAVREIESWLLADREHLAAYLSIPIDNIPESPDQEDDPKRTLINIVQKKCRNKSIREDMVPKLRSGRSEGTGYAGRIAEFLDHESVPWRPAVAAENSESLQRCIRALQLWQS